jgi:HSP20 family molecular chaperone IbpA
MGGGVPRTMAMGAWRRGDEFFVQINLPGVDEDDVAFNDRALRGSVRSWSERYEAQKAAYAAPGVWTVHNHVTVREDLTHIW